MNKEAIMHDAISIAAFTLLVELIGELETCGIISSDQKSQVLLRARTKNAQAGKNVNSDAARLISELLPG